MSRPLRPDRRRNWRAAVHVNDVVEVGHQLLHASCAEDASPETAQWNHVRIGTLNQISRGTGTATIPG